MPSVEDSAADVLAAPDWEDRVARIRRIPENHGVAAQSAIYAQVARAGYVPLLAPDFAYVHPSDFYEYETFLRAYTYAATETSNFADVSVESLMRALEVAPQSLLVFRTLLGLTSTEFSYATQLVAAGIEEDAVSKSRIDNMERKGTEGDYSSRRVIAETIARAVEGSLFGEPPGELRSKQDKPDTALGWQSVQAYADDGVPYVVFLHQRHYGGAFRQLLDATSTLRGDLIEDAVEDLFRDSRLQYIRTGSHNQSEVAERFGISVTPAPDFVVYDRAGRLAAILECKGANDGGTARDKALRFQRLRSESTRLGGVPLIAVLGGMGWARVNDTLGPVLRDTDGRVFTLANLREMLTVSPFPALIADNK